jgi:hypothetical protein
MSKQNDITPSVAEKIKVLILPSDATGVGA